MTISRTYCVTIRRSFRLYGIYPVAYILTPNVRKWPESLHREAVDEMQSFTKWFELSLPLKSAGSPRSKPRLRRRNSTCLKA